MADPRKTKKDISAAAKNRILVAGTEMRQNKLTFIAIRDVFGIGKTKSDIIAKKLGFERKKIKELTKEELGALNKEVQKEKIEDDLRREVQDNIRDLKDMRSKRGLRLAAGLPNRGQRTSSNAKTSKKLKR